LLEQHEAKYGDKLLAAVLKI